MLIEQRGSASQLVGVTGAAGAEEGKKTSSGEFRLARATQGDASSTTSVSGGASTSSDDRTSLEEVVVKGQYEFLSVDTSGATNLPLPIEKIPQSISLVSADFLKAADLRTLDAIAEYTPGAINAGNGENFGSTIMLRGFASGRAVDGINIIQAVPLYEPDPAIYDRLEIVKGPSSVVYGVGSPGGVVNYVTKSATAQTPSYLSVQGGSWDTYRVEGQIAGALDPDQRVRAIGVAAYEKGDSFLDEIYHENTTLYGGLNFTLSDSVAAYLHGGYQRSARTSFDGILAEPDGSAAPVSRSFFIGAGDVVESTNAYHAEGNLTWQILDMWDVSIKGNYEYAKVGGGEQYTYGLDTTGDFFYGTGTFQRFTNQNYGIGVSSVYKFDSLGLKDSFLSIAALYQSDQYALEGVSPISGGGSANIADGEAAIGRDIDALFAQPQAPFSQLTSAKTLTFSGQTVVQPIDRLSILLGVSFSKPEVDTSTNLSGSAEDLSIGEQTSYRAGLTYEVLPKTNAYVSFSQSFNPQTYVELTGVVPPLTGDQYEAGLKFRSDDGRLLLTGALYQIRERNVATFDQQIGATAYYRAIGEVTHKGIELQSVGQITPEWQISAGYSYLNPKDTRDLDPMAMGQTQLFLPKQTADLYTTYVLRDGVLRGLSFGAGVRYVSPEQTAYSDATPPTRNLPGYLLIDPTLGYSIGQWRVQVNSHNVLDKRYFVNNYQSLLYGNVPGDPRNFAVTLRYTF